MTIYDIAQEANVSASTVSRIINNKKGVKASTREKVNNLLIKHNYYPDEIARGLVNQSSKCIGVLVSDLRIMHNTEGAYIIESELSKLGYLCIIMNTGSKEKEKENGIRSLASQRVKATVMIGSTFKSENVKKGIKKYLSDMPVVLVNGFIDLPNVYSVLSEERKGVSNCVRLLVEKGKKNLAFVGDTITPSNQQKQQGFTDEVKRLGLLYKPIIVDVEGSNVIMNSYNATKKLLYDYPEINGIVYVTDLTASGGVRALIDLGIKIPEQVSAIGIDNSIYAEICYPKLTSLDNKLLDLSLACVKIVTNALEGKKVPKKTIIMTEIVVRETT